MDFDTFFKQATGNDPFPYQRQLATGGSLPQLIDVPTGAGKTAAAILSWLWRRRFAEEQIKKATPRRLVYCLPMRVLVEQTVDIARRWLKNLEACLQEDIHVYILMGGEEAEDWDVYPERDAILVGTQDMLLSRTLNRGYGMSRYRWPMHFGLLNNDCLWILDEIQLMGSGLATTAQLQVFREKLGTWGTVQTIWMSATLQRNWLATVDFKDKVSDLSCLELRSEDRNVDGLRKRLQAKKPIKKADPTAGETEEIATLVKQTHQAGSLTLVVVNTVDRARELYDAIHKFHEQHAENKYGKKNAAAASTVPNGAQPELLLIHSRFRPPERLERNRKLTIADKAIRRESLPSLNDEEKAWVGQVQKEGLIVVATQVVEAGVDISAKTLLTELAPWASLVQRFGRCNRFGKDDNAIIFWIFVPIDGKKNLPYDDKEMKAARDVLESPGLRDVGPASLEKSLTKAELFPYEHTHVIRQHDLHGLFSTEPDLAGGFTDVSPFVRDRERNSDVYVLWRIFEGDKPESDQPLVNRDELCHVPFYDLKDFLGDKGYAWEWNGEIGEWEKRRAKEIRPGMTLLLHVNRGGYHQELGWTGRSQDKPSSYERGEEKQDDLKSEPASQTDWLSVPNHLRDVEAEARLVVSELDLHNLPEGMAVEKAAQWHDLGKCHAQWQAPLKELAPEREGSPWAKFRGVRNFRPGLRHEAASALAAWQQWQAGADGWTALTVYLVAAHHGKVRTVLRSTDSGDDVFGIKPVDSLPPLTGWLSEKSPLDLRPKVFGAVGDWNESQETFTLAMPSWIGMVAELLGPELPEDPTSCEALPQDEPRGLGPFRLAFLETLVRVADARGSRNPGRSQRS